MCDDASSGETQDLFVPFEIWTEKITAYSIMDGTRTKTLAVKGFVIAGTPGHGNMIAVLVVQIIGGKQRFFLDICDPQMTQWQHHISIDLADNDEVRFIDLSRCDARVAVLTLKGLWTCPVSFV
jgi:hypothetical protein